MSTRLEKVYLMNVLLYVDSVTTMKLFIQVSTRCWETSQMLRINPFKISFKTVCQNPTLFPHLETIYELKDNDEMEEFKKHWIDKIAFIRNIQSYVVYFFFPQPLSTTQIKFFEKIEEYSAVRLTAHYLDDLVNTIRYFTGLKTLKIGFASGFNFRLLNTLPSLERVYIIFQYTCHEDVIKAFERVDITRVKYVFIVNSVVSPQILARTFSDIKRRYQEISLYATLLEKSIKNNFYFTTLCNVDPSYFQEDATEIDIQNFLPIEMKICSKEPQNLSVVDVGKCEFLKALTIMFNNERPFAVLLPSGLKTLSVEGTQAMFSLNNVPVEFLNLTRMHNQWDFSFSSLVSLSLYQCQHLNMDLTHCDKLEKVGVCCCADLELKVPTRVKLCGMYFSTRLKVFIKENESTFCDLSLQDVIHFWLSRSMKMVVEVKADLFDLTQFRLKMISLYDCSVKRLILPKTILFVRLVNCLVEKVLGGVIRKITVQSKSIISDIEANYIGKVHLGADVELWNVGEINVVSYRRSTVRPHLKCRRIVLKSKERFVDLSMCTADRLSVSSKTKTDVVLINHSFSSVFLNNVQLMILGQSEKVFNRKALISKELGKKNAEISETLSSDVFRASNKNVEVLDLSHTTIKKVIVRNCKHLHELILPHTCTKTHVQHCNELQHVRAI
ncbi:hypothetical protein EIN_145890 [Entamoeba invadens IP1]|uniref:Uncharacterized protein n=1 Tax=Entamoeba invadens IP1 TaxID=370355 RepID=L7FLW0_ENTIV|nr:hypothetical protein EIN_145890 [Entamoeba invadens IP1]ELP87605.1 hypothetical protein EIN_145890 [Entamoeba invadens IP1]|eukprot:XP_004254376.1 hypothetical protein EIN_145890 [Entamoeba invadens IP1]